MRKIFFISFFLLSSMDVFACEACGIASSGGYVGILPQFNRHFVGVRYQFQYFSSTSSLQVGARNQEYYHTCNIFGRFSPHKRVQIIMNAPLHYFSQTDQGVKRELFGPGDLSMLVLYQVIKSPDTLVKRMRHSLQLGGGIKLPTGRYAVYDSNGFYDRNMQPGTGSWDFLLTAQYNIRWKGWGINAETNARISTINPDNYLYGHKVNTNLKGFYWGQGKKISVLATVGMRYDYGSKDAYLQQKLSNTGGHMVSGSSSVDLYFKKWVIGTEFRMPFYANMSGGLLNPGPQIMSQFMFMF